MLVPSSVVVHGVVIVRDLPADDRPAQVTFRTGGQPLQRPNGRCRFHLCRERTASSAVGRGVLLGELGGNTPALGHREALAPCPLPDAGRLTGAAASPPA